MKADNECKEKQTKYELQMTPRVLRLYQNNDEVDSIFLKIIIYSFKQFHLFTFLLIELSPILNISFNNVLNNFNQIKISIDVNLGFAKNVIFLTNVYCLLLLLLLLIVVEIKTRHLFELLTVLLTFRVFMLIFYWTNSQLCEWTKRKIFLICIRIDMVLKLDLYKMDLLISLKLHNLIDTLFCTFSFSFSN